VPIGSLLRQYPGRHTRPPIESWTVARRGAAPIASDPATQREPVAHDSIMRTVPLMRDGEEEAVRWLSYSQIAELRGISRTSAERIVRRAKWRRQVDNQGVTRAAVPLAYADFVRTGPRDGQAERQEDRQAESPPDSTSLAVLQGAVDALRQRAERAEAETDSAHKRADVAVALADRTLAQLAETSAEVEKLRDRLDAAEGRARVAEDVVAQLRGADEARKVRGRWARLRAAWRGG
jgi:hypothetical protein